MTDMPPPEIKSMEDRMHSIEIEHPVIDKFLERLAALERDVEELRRRVLIIEEPLR